MVVLIPSMEMLCWDLRERGDPGLDVLGIGVELLALKPWVEDPEVGLGVGTSTGSPLPVSVVIGNVDI